MFRLKPFNIILIFTAFAMSCAPLSFANAQTVAISADSSVGTLPGGSALEFCVGDAVDALNDQNLQLILEKPEVQAVDNPQIAYHNGIVQAEASNEWWSNAESPASSAHSALTAMFARQVNPRLRASNEERQLEDQILSPQRLRSVASYLNTGFRPTAAHPPAASGDVGAPLQLSPDLRETAPVSFDQSPLSAPEPGAATILCALVAGQLAALAIRRSRRPSNRS